MGFGCRAFILHENGRIRRLGLATLDALYGDESGEGLLDWIGLRPRIALVYVRIVRRIPEAIRSIQGVMFTIGPDGRFSADELADSRRNSMQMFVFDEPADILEALRPGLARLRNERYRWEPTSTERRKLTLIVLGGF